MAPKTSEVPEVGLDEHERQQRQRDEAGADDRAQARPMAACARGHEVRQHDGHEDLGHLGELELQPQDGDPAGHAAGAAGRRRSVSTSRRC